MATAHRILLEQWPSAYAMSKETGVPLTTAKRWRKRGVIADPRWWLPLLAHADYRQAKRPTWCYWLTLGMQEEP